MVCLSAFGIIWLVLDAFSILGFLGSFILMVLAFWLAFGDWDRFG